jgi:hypothetical protein
MSIMPFLFSLFFLFFSLFLLYPLFLIFPGVLLFFFRVLPNQSHAPACAPRDPRRRPAEEPPLHATPSSRRSPAAPHSRPPASQSSRRRHAASPPVHPATPHPDRLRPAFAPTSCAALRLYRVLIVVDMGARGEGGQSRMEPRFRGSASPLEVDRGSATSSPFSPFGRGLRGAGALPNRASIRLAGV